MEDIKNTNTEEVVETNTEATTDNNKADAELFELLNKALAKREAGIAKSILKDNGMADDEISEVIGRYKASKQAAKTQEAEALSTLQKQNAELTKKLFDIELNGAAAKVAAEIGLDVSKLSYAMKLADMTQATNDGKINSDALKSALEDVLKNVPEFKSKQTTQEDKGGIRKVGADHQEPETTDALSKMRKALGLTEKSN